MAHEDIAKLKIDKPAAVLRPGLRKHLSRWIVALLLAGAAGLLYSTGVLIPAVQVEVATISPVYPSQTFTLLNASGYVVAQRKAAVASKISSRLDALMVEEGSLVKKGEVIARLEGEDLLAARNQAAANLHVANSHLDQAKAELQDATQNYNRSKALMEKGYIAKADFDFADARHNKARAAVAAAVAAITASTAALQNATVQLEYTLLRAPFDAVVLTKNADVGDIVTPVGAAVSAKASVVTIADMDSLMVEVDVSEANITQVKKGQPCEVILDALPESRFRGAVHMIVPTADRSKATVLVKVRFLKRDRRILPEMSARVAFLAREPLAIEQKPRIAINPATVITAKGRTLVYLIRDNRVVATPIRLGAPIGDLREVLAGLKVGDKVAAKPLEKLQNGTRIKLAGE